MAQESAGQRQAAAGSGNKVAGNIGDKKARTRKEYEHEMTDQERYALQTVQRATAGLRTINDAIKSGKKVNPDVVKLCHQLNQAVGDMLFAAS